MNFCLKNSRVLKNSIPLFKKCNAKNYFSTHGQPLTSLSEDEQLFQEAVSRFAKDVVAPKVKEMDQTGDLDMDIAKQMFENGMMGIEIAEEMNGSGASFINTCLAVEELSKIDPSIGLLCDLQNTVINNMFRLNANQSLQEEYLPELATNMIGSFCLSETTSGSDAFSLKTTAELSKDKSYYTLNGNKMWISNAGYAGVFLVFANVDTSKGYKGITCFVVDRETEGLEIGSPEDKLGIRASSTCPLFFTNMKVPSSKVLGEVGHGYKYAINLLNEGRIGIASQMVGLAQGVFDCTLPYLLQRKQFGKFIGEFQGMQHQYAQIATEIECSRLLTYNAARLKENNMPFSKEAAMAKLYSSQIAEKTASKCIEWLGGVGFTKDMLAEKFYRDAKIGSIYEGTSNMQLTTIAKLLMKDYE